MTIEIANRLCAYRKAHGLSQEELAEKMGVSRQAVSKWERAEASPDTDNLILLSQIYGVTLDALLNDDPVEPISETDHVSFKNGIHVHAKNGDRVDIGFNGIHVDSAKGEHVHIGFDGFHVNDGHVFHGEPEPMPAWYQTWKRFPLPALCCIAYLLIGFFLANGWAYGWLVFLGLPLYYTLGTAIAKGDPHHFAYPVLATLIYLMIGFFGKIWHPSWIVFLTIPIYYFITAPFKKGSHS